MMIYATPFRRAFDAAILIVFILLLRKLFFKKLNPSVLRISWGVVALRILIPVKLPLFQSIYTRLHLTDYVDYIEQNIGTWTIDALLDIDYARATGEPVSNLMLMKGNVLKFSDHFLMGHTLSDFFIGIGQAGSLICLLVFTVQNILFYVHVNRHSSIYGMKDNLPVYIIDDYGGSCLTGIANPKIYVSQRALTNVKWCQWIVKHELGHYQSKDNWYGLISNICLILQWYNPFVWYVARAAAEDCEVACDYRILRGADKKECIEYGKCLIGMATGGSEKYLHSAATVSHMGKGSLKRRIVQIACHMDGSSGNPAGSYWFLFSVLGLFLLCIMGG